MAANSVDIHILTTPYTQPNWMYECLCSLRGEPANVHLCKGIWGNLGASRAFGFSIGNAPYVSFVDHDDMVTSGAIAECVAYLDNNPGVAGVYTDQMLIDAHGNDIQEGWSSCPQLYADQDRVQLTRHPKTGEFTHHLMMFRREVLQDIDFNNKPKIVEPYIVKAICKRGELAHIKRQGYKWRIHSGNTFPTFTEEEVQQVLSDLTEEA